MTQIPESEIQRLRASDLVEVVARYGIKLERAGPEFRACCPFHDETTPSFTITPSKNLFYCFGCGASGGPIDFVMQYEGVEFPRAVEIMGGGLPVAADGAKQRREATERPPEPDAWAYGTTDAQPPTTLRVQRGGDWREFPVVAAWAYRNATGDVIAYDCRIEPELGKKDIIPVCWRINTETGEARWKQGSLPKPRSLYGAELLAAHPGRQVLVVEGCKTADAARRMLADKPVVVVSWMGGGKAVRFTDWSPLAGRKVVVWPDCDSQRDKSGEFKPYIEQAGMAAALDIAELAADAELRIVAVPAPGSWPDGYDLADAETDNRSVERMLEFMRANLSTPKQIRALHVEQQQPTQAETPPASDDAPPDDYAPQAYDDELPETRQPAPPAGDNQPFRMLGWDRDTAYYLPDKSEQIVALTASAHTKNNLISLAPLSYWEDTFPSGKKVRGNSSAVDWDMANNALIQRSQGIGIYDPDLVRGRGAWWEDGKWAVHLGDRVIIDGESYSLRKAPTRYVYEKSARMSIQFENPLAAPEAVKLVQICERLRWMKPISGKLLAGWVFLAPICGAIDWRPHIWITGGAGSGKSTVMRHVIGRCLKGICLQVEGDTSEAGIRQSLVHDARPVVFDEFESDRKKAIDRVEDVLAMVTRASSESDAQLLKGSGDGKATGYRTRAMFAFSSIAVNMRQFAAASRVTVLDLISEPESEKSLATYNAIMADLFATLTPDYIQRLQARAVHMIPVVRQNALTFAEAAAITLKSRRMGDQIGALLAGVYALHSGKAISREDAVAWIQRQNWDDVAEVSDGRDESNCSSYLLSYQMRVETSNGPVTRTVGELIQRAARSGESATDTAVSEAEALATLKRSGIRVDGLYGDAKVSFANKHREIQRMLAGTSWETSYWRTLQRIPGAEKHDPMKYGALTTRGITLPLSAVM